MVVSLIRPSSPHSYRWLVRHGAHRDRGPFCVDLMHLLPAPSPVAQRWIDGLESRACVQTASLPSEQRVRAARAFRVWEQIHLVPWARFQETYRALATQSEPHCNGVGAPQGHRPNQNWRARKVLEGGLHRWARLNTGHPGQMAGSGL